ncbi:MAG: hypothetical protein ACLQNE_46825 [Thermoguttaceae bacterium]
MKTEWMNPVNQFARYLCMTLAFALGPSLAAAAAPPAGSTGDQLTTTDMPPGTRCKIETSKAAGGPGNPAVASKTYVGSVVRITDKGIVLSVSQPTGKSGSSSGSVLTDNPLARLLGFGEPAKPKATKGEVLIPFVEIDTIQLLDPSGGAMPAVPQPAATSALPNAPTPQ